MNKEIINGNWNIFKGKLKEKWGEISDDDIEACKGNILQIAGRLQKIYGYSKKSAESELNGFIDSIEKSVGKVEKKVKSKSKSSSRESRAA